MSYKKKKHHHGFSVVLYSIFALCVACIVCYLSWLLYSYVFRYTSKSYTHIPSIDFLSDRTSFGVDIDKFNESANIVSVVDSDLSSDIKKLASVVSEYVLVSSCLDIISKKLYSGEDFGTELSEIRMAVGDDCFNNDIGFTHVLPYKEIVLLSSELLHCCYVSDGIDDGIDSPIVEKNPAKQDLFDRIASRVVTVTKKSFGIRHRCEHPNRDYVSALGILLSSMDYDGALSLLDSLPAQDCKTVSLLREDLVKRQKISFCISQVVLRLKNNVVYVAKLIK